LPSELENSRKAAQAQPGIVRTPAKQTELTAKITEATTRLAIAEKVSRLVLAHQAAQHRLNDALRMKSEAQEKQDREGITRAAEIISKVQTELETTQKEYLSIKGTLEELKLKALDRHKHPHTRLYTQETMIKILRHLRYLT